MKITTFQMQIIPSVVIRYEVPASPVDLLCSSTVGNYGIPNMQAIVHVQVMTDVHSLACRAVRGSSDCVRPEPDQPLSFHNQ